jgi:hypothetical protein
MIPLLCFAPKLMRQTLSLNSNSISQTLSLNYDEVFMDGQESTFPISVDNISNAYYGLDLTRLKVYCLENFQVKKNRETKKASTTSSS